MSNRNSSVDSFDSAEDNLGNGLDSTSALIVIVPENEDDDADIPFHLASDTDDEEEQDSSDIDWLSVSHKPLSSIIVFLYLLSPFLALGALFLPDGRIPLKFGIPALCIFALLSTFARYIWYMLTRYVGKTTLEDIIMNAFARTRRNEGRRTVIKVVVKLGDFLLRILLATMFLKSSVDVLRPMLSPKMFLLRSRITLTVILALAILPLCIPQSFASRRVIFSTAASVLAYVSWLACTAYLYATWNLEVSASWVRMGALWEGPTAIAFAFTASSTISLYGSLKAKHQHARIRPTKPYQSFRTLLLISSLSAVALILPCLFFTASPNPSQVAGVSPQHLRASLHAATLLLTIPSVLVRCPNMLVSTRRLSNVPISRILTLILVLALSLVPSKVFAVLSDITLASALFGTYLLPACIHIIIHNFKRPLSIIMPPQSPSASNRVSTTFEDELLQRKERTLQRHRLFRRLVWDVGVWVLLLPIGGGGIVWAAGRLFGRW